MGKGTATRTLRLHEDYGWMQAALCSHDPELSVANFYPRKGDSNRPALAGCFLCPVRRECLNYAMIHNEEYGVWGGSTRGQRRAFKRLGVSLADALILTEERWLRRRER